MTRSLAALWIGLAVLTGCARPGPVVRAQQLVRLHRDAEAIALLRARLAEAPDDRPAQRLLVRVLAWSGDLDGARREVDALAQRDAHDPVALIELGHAYELAHRFDEALAAYDEAARAAPDKPEGPREGGLRCARWGEVEEARPRLEEAEFRRGARDGEVFHALGLVRLHLGDADAAEAAYKQGLAANPKSHENLLGLATVALSRGDAASALAAYDALLAVRPTYAPAELGRAWALAKIGRVSEARHALDRAAELGAPPANVAKQRALLQ